MIGGCAYDASVPNADNTLTVVSGDSVFNFRAVSKATKTDDQLAYHWFANGSIQRTIGDYSGKLLHGPFEVKNMKSNLLIKGEYTMGLKDGVWKAWYVNGNLKSVYHYNEGLLDGEYALYTEDGHLLKKGNYNDDRLHGKISSYAMGEEVVHKYRKGELIPEKQKEEKPARSEKNPQDEKGFLKTLFQKKENDPNPEDLIKENRKNEKRRERELKKVERARRKAEKEQSKNSKSENN